MCPKVEWFGESPVEHHIWHGVSVWVKREDLAPVAPLPPLAKMRGVAAMMHRLAADGVASFGVLDTRVSKSGLGVAVFAHALGVPCNYYFPAIKGEDWQTPTRQEAQRFGAELVPLTAGRIGIVYARAKAREPGIMLPLGFPLRETVEATAEVLRDTNTDTYTRGTIVVPVGTGTILAGILAGLAQTEAQPRRIYGITASMSTQKVAAKIRQHLGRLRAECRNLPPLTLVKQGTDYYSPSEVTGPVPGSPYYEGKAWEWLEGSIGRLPQPVLFWNIGR